MINFFKIFKTEKEQPNLATGDDSKIFSNYIRGFQKETEKLIENLSFTKSPGELLPPWVVKIYPLEIDDQVMDGLGVKPMTYYQADSWYWYPDRNSGEGGDYKIDFDIFFNSLTTDEKEAYFQKYDLGKSWKEREMWFDAIFLHNETVSEKEYYQLFVKNIGKNPYNE